MKKIYLKLMALALLSVLSVTNAWAAPWVCRSTAGGKIASKTVGDKLNNGSEWNYTYTTNGGWDGSGDFVKVYVGTSTSSYTSVSSSWVSDDGSNKNVKANIGNVTFDKSGKWYAVGVYKSGGTTAYTTTNSTWTSNTTFSMGSNGEPYWEVTPPSVKSFAVSTTGSDILSGTGSSADPYIIAYNGSLVLTLSGSKNKTDANSSLQYNTAGTWNTTTSRTISSITSTTKTSVTVKMRCYNSTASLSGTESSSTIYYKSEDSYSVTAAKTPSVGGSVTPSSATNMGVTSGGTITASPNTGYTFGGWAVTSGSGSFDDDSEESTTFYPTAASTITASFTAKTTTVTLSANAPGGQTVTGGGTTVTATYDSALPAFVALSCTGGYALKGYFDNTSGGNKIINADGSFNANSGIWNRTDGATLTLHAQWSLDRTLTYDGNGETSGDIPADATSYANGTKVTVLGNVAASPLDKTGYTFDDWNTEAGGGGSSYSAGDKITMDANYTLFAQWSENDYTVTVTNGSNGSVASGSVTGHYDTKVTLPTATANTGYHFSTWTTTSGSVTYTNQTSATSAQVNGLTATATVRADFAANTYSVVFNKNGGSGTMSNQSFTYNAAAKALTSNSFTYSGYTFLGWATSSERAAALTVDYTDGQSVRNLTSTHNGTFNLYAVWAKKYYIGGRFQHDWEEGSATTNEMTYDATTGYYKFETNKTVNELSVQWHNVSGDYYADQAFYIHTGLGKGATSAKPTYVGASSNGHNMETKIGYSNAYVLTAKTSSFDSFADAVLLKFTNTDNLSSNVIVWWDPANRKVWYTATESLNTNYYLLGFGSGSWGETDARRFKVASVNATTATVSVSLTAKTYTYNTADGFKVKNGSSYYSANGTMEREDCTDWDFSTGTNNCGIIADLAGTYTFTLNLSNRQVSVTYPTAYTVTFSANTISGSNGQTSDPTATYNSGATSVTSGDYVPNGTSVTFTAAAAKSGYTWNGWYDATTGGTKKSVGSNLSYSETVSGSAITRYARYTQNTHSVTLTNANSTYGTVNTASPVTVGEAEAVQIQATPKTGYMFNGWNLTTGSGITYHVAAGADQIVDGTGATKSTTYITTTANATLQATWDEDRSSGYFVHYGNDGKNADGGTDASQTRDWADGNLYKKAGETAGTVSYWTFTAGAADVTKVIEFKVLAGDPADIGSATWYGYKAAGGGKIDGSIVDQTLSTSYGNGRMVVVMPGDYVFKWDSNTKQLSITYPTGNYLRGDFNSWGWDYELTSTGVANEYSCTVSLAAGQTWTAPDYGFKVAVNGVHYGKNSTAITRASNTASSLGTSGSNIGLTTDVAGNYTFVFNSSSKNLSVTYPTAYTITYGAGTINGSDAAIGVSPSFTSGAYVLPETDVTFSKGSTKDGYTWKGWYSNSNGSGTLHSNTDANYTWSATRTGDVSVYACYTLNNYTITYNLNGGSNPVIPAPVTSYTVESAAITLPTPTRTGYTFAGWYENADLSTGGVKTTIPAGSTGNKVYYAKWTPITYTIRFNGNGSTSGSMSNQTGVTYDAATTITSNAFVKTGYNFAGWATSADGDVVRADGAAHGNLTSTNGATVDLYAKWNAKTCTVTFDFDESDAGYGSKTGATTSTSATYDAAMTSVTPPTAGEGYAFMGYYTAADGGGTQYYDGEGHSAANWAVDTESATKLYAYYKKAEITALTFDAGTVEPETTVGVTPTISPEPEGTTTICWTILHSNDTPLDPQPSMTWSEGKLTFAASAYSGTYKVQAVLRTGNSCGGGTQLDSETASFVVAGSHSVNVYYKCGGDVIKASTSVIGRPTEWSDDITAPDVFGYTFSSWSSADGVTIKDSEHEDVTSSTESTIKIKAIYAGSLTANYTQKQMIYFKNTLEWENVYVNFYTDSYWNNPKGSGNNGVTKQNIAMTQYGETDIWYYDYGSASITPSLYVSFTSESQSGMENFWKAGGVNVVYPANYQDDIHTNKSSETGFKAATPMFVPLATQEKVTLNQSSGGKADYYNDGYWTTYTPGTGYRLEIYNSAGDNMIKYKDFESADDLMPMKAVVDLEGGQTYKFQIRRGGESSAGVYYGNSGTMTYTDHGQDTPWAMTNSPFSMAGITANAAGDYTFNLSYSPNGSNQYRLRVAVDYPVASGDYRLVYSDAVQTKPLTSAIVNKVNDGTDIVSFFVRPGSSPELRIQQATIEDNVVKWKEYPTPGTPTDQITGDIATALTSGGTDVYNFNLSMNGSGALNVASVEKYDGKYYIRTDAANSKWDNYRTDPDHVITYSEYSITHGGYTHYYTHWVDKDVTGRKNVKFVIANDYSPNISDTLAREAASGTWEHISDFIEEGGDLKRSANVRFMWDKRDNTISRAYVDGAQTEGTQFLTILSADSKILNPSTEAVQATTTFSDKGNWMYEANVKAYPGAEIKLKSSWGKDGETDHIIDQYFKGTAEDPEQLIGGSTGGPYDIRLIYDFKTNRLIAGLIPSGNIEDPMAINADVMFVREHHGDIAQLTFTDDGAITDIKTAFGVLQFNKWTINNKSKAEGHSPLAPLLSRFERDLFYISFPFKVAMEDVFGFGTYGQHWIIEEYDGATRAANGYWQESDPNWKFIFNRKNKYFEPGIGYIIALDLDEMGESSSVWTNTDRVELYFPSYGTMDDITKSTATYDIPEHECTINRSEESNGHGGTLGSDYDRRVKDSHWNVLGVPTYVNPDAPDYANTDWTTEATETSIGPNFLYEWNKTDNSVTAVSAEDYTYHAMHAYLVQYCGEVTWTSSVSVKPVGPAPRRNPDAPKDAEYRLELRQNDVTVDQTFVRLSSDERVTTGFEFNYDLSKEFNAKKSNIYTLIGTEQVAGNVLPLTEQTTVVPVGVVAKKTGDYTFAIPEGTNGVGVTLIDNETGIRTSLSALDYTVNLTAGTYNERFVLEISPIKHMPTGIEMLNGENGENAVRKILIDGIMYIVKDGKMFDAQGKRVQ